MINVDKYLQRLQVKKEAPTESLLKKLVIAHQCSIPLENLDFYYNVAPEFNPKQILERIIDRRKGGNALQLHAIFYQLLNQLGFQCELRSVHPFNLSKETYEPRLSHSGIVVKIKAQQFYVDLGTIHGLSLPIPIDFNKTLLSATNYFCLKKKEFDDHLYLEKSKDALRFHSFQQIESREIRLIEYLTVYNQYSESNHPEKRSRYLFRRTRSGYVLIVNNTFEQLELGQLQSKDVQNEEEFWSLAVQHFSIDQQRVLSPEVDS